MKKQSVRKSGVSRSVARYEAAMRSRGLAPERRRKAVSTYARALDEEARAVQAIERLVQTAGVSRVGERRMLDSLARGIAGVVRREPQGEWPEAVARRVMHRVNRGMASELLLDATEAVLAGLGHGTALASSVRAEVARQCEEVKGRCETARTASGPSLYQDRVRLDRLQAELEQPTELDRFRLRAETAMLGKALSCIRPWARKVVAARLARRRSYAELASQFRLPVRDVAAILRQARALVAAYTHYFSDDWYWADVARKPEGGE